ncbi:MAG: hypothetical protein K8R36_21135 [Planctomycetales bacterium]|nr:hypothetical protein [Planctomycetales bacterium]
MINHASHLRPLLPAAFSLLVLVSNWHCQVGAAEVVREMVARQLNEDGSPARPINLPQGGCENESGCMCRGATLAVSVDLAPFAPELAEMLAVPTDGVAISREVPQTSPPDALFFRSPPLSGRILRAHLASFLN